MTLPISSHSEQFGTLGQISLGDLELIAKQGYKSVINNRPDFEGGADQPTNTQIEAQAKALGLSYAYLPVIPGSVTSEQVVRMANLLETLPAPILAYCRSGARSTNLYQRTLLLR